MRASVRHPLSRAPIGTGPFGFVDWKEGDRLVLKANPRYLLGRPKLDGLVIRFIPDPAARLLEFKNGTVHFAFFAPGLPDDFTAAKTDPRLVTRTYTGVWNYFFAVDHSNPLFKDARVRQAFSHAFDRKRVLKDFWGGYGALGEQPDQPRAVRPDPEGRGARVRSPERPTAAAPRPAGSPGPDGVLVKDGKRFEFAIVNFPGPSKDMAVVYQDSSKPRRHRRAGSRRSTSRPSGASGSGRGSSRR